MKRGLHGFTLIELLVVISIISLLSSVVFASVNTARRKARDVKRFSATRQVQLALELYYDDNGFYPQVGWVHSVDATWQTNSLANALRPYLPVLPVDPTNSGCCAYNGGYTFSYYSSAYFAPGQTTQQWYMFLFRFEDQSHSAQALDGSLACSGTYFHYGNGANGMMTLGGNCI